jgi:importin subunit beta-1
LSHRLEQVITLPFFPELVEEILTILENQDFDSSHDSHSPFLTLSTSILLQCLSLQSQSEPNDDYGSAEAAAVGLQLLTEKSEDDEESGEQFHSLVLPFIQSNITHDDWRKRDAAIMAFGTIIGTPLRQSQRNLQLVRAMIPILLTSSQPNHTPALIRSSAVWAIGRLFQGNLSFLLSANISPTPLLNGLTNSLSDPNARVQEQTVSAIAHFGEALPEDIRDSSVRAILSLLVGRLFQFTSPQSNPNLDSKVKFASYSALSCLIENNPLEDEQQAVMLLEEVIRRLQWALEHSIADLEPLCGFLSSSFVSLSFGSLQPHADTLVNLLLRSLPYTPSDGFISLGRLISECPEAIQTHHAAILGAVIRRLDSDPCQDSISLVGDICHSFLEGVTPYAHTLIPRLLAILHNPNHRSDQLPHTPHLTSLRPLS